ncbi:uncharacterized protein LOC126907526 isoform X2 [Daktulosphaira vitifoliae]|uniref:uncharacterized protein LOC126907526 isoform X2 n=1 Tax=Daktulosphaira vitifoliae TaxID=58002 RepID=UPI0021A9BF23|nr:uncharacterized protein LOC126907526 isoform X2 [Daktulosphaira vitifoliae]
MRIAVDEGRTFYVFDVYKSGIILWRYLGIFQLEIMPQHCLPLGLFFFICWFVCEICPVDEVSYASKQNKVFSFWLNNCSEAEWFDDHPLPLPTWGISKPVFTIYSLEEYEELVRKLENELQILLKSKNIDSVTNFIWFYNHYKSKMEDQSFDKFFREYEPMLNDNANNCVGLSLLLIGKLAKLDEFFPGIRECLYLVSCDRNCKNIEKYISDIPNPLLTIIKHVLVSLKIEIFGRKGVLLLDPGYSIARVITVMSDNLSPHTGYFPASTNAKKSYIFEMDSSERYIEWLTYSTDKIEDHALIYIDAPYLSPISVTERRNLVDNYRALYSMNEKDYNHGNLEDWQHIKVPYEDFVSNKRISNKFEVFLCHFSEQFKLTKEEFLTMLITLANILNDEQFLNYRKSTDDRIFRIANWN